MGAARYPFSAIVGHDDLRLALLLTAVHPGIGGVLVRGEKGTAKSTVVRALSALLPAVTAVPGCRFGCDPVAPDSTCPDGPHAAVAGQSVRPARLVELPVGATEDRLVGSLDLQRALTEGVSAYQPGLLAAAHRGVLYVDEVNLLPDHLVDVLLDAAAMGRAHVERDGVSISHAASFLLVGTMNPEEGELRPQLLDRFGLTVEVAASRDVETRAEVIRRRLGYEADPAGFAAVWHPADVELAEQIVVARRALPEVVLPDAELRRIATVCAAFEVDGMRADLVLARTAMAHAAWRGGAAVVEQDIRVAAALALPHRRRRDPFDQPGLDGEQLEDALRTADQPPDDPPDGPDGGGAEQAADGEHPAGTCDGEHRAGAGNGATGDRPLPAPTAPFRARMLALPGLGAGAPGRRSPARTSTGRTIRPSASEGSGLHLLGTLAAAAPHQRDRGRCGAGLVVHRADVRRAVRVGRESNLVLFAVDASGSMAARARMSAVTGAVLSLLRDAYQRRDKVGLISFRGTEAQLVLPPTSAVDAAAARLSALRTGGRTPLAAGLLRSARVLATERLRDADRRALLVVLTDGRATHGGMDTALVAAGLLRRDGVASIVVDCESGPVRLGLPDLLAVALGGACVRLAELSADAVAGVVRAVRSAA
ncbi:MAG: magnesium chelatase [Pseudonocardiales bacterium]|nr:magnesium chelatase subunit D family protein [Actinomycetota bacterium]PZS24371.1 MAG: magnesium chelatase [Pseudonocardiales bacterium]